MMALDENPIGCSFAILRWACLIALAVHLGWSWWLVALFFAILVVKVEVT